MTSKLVKDNRDIQKGVSRMDKEQILELSRQENKDQDIFELEVNNKAQRLGGIIAIIVTIVCILCEHLDLHGDAHSSYLLILTSGLTGMWGIRVAKLRRKSVAKMKKRNVAKLSRRNAAKPKRRRK